MPDDVTFQAACGPCGASGVYQGFAEPKGEAVICLACGGSGAQELSYTPFTGRVQKRGVQFVSAPTGRFIFGTVGPQPGTKMTYQEFLDSVPAAPAPKTREL